MQGVPGLENISGTSNGALFNSKEDWQGWPSPGSLQHNSQDFVAESSGPWWHWQDSKPYARQIEPKGRERKLFIYVKWKRNNNYFTKSFCLFYSFHILCYLVELYVSISSNSPFRSWLQLKLILGNWNLTPLLLLHLICNRQKKPTWRRPQNVLPLISPILQNTMSEQ